MMTRTILQADDLSKTYISGGLLFSKRKYVGAVDKISVKIDAGQTVGVIGESGSGKSTLGRLLLGLETPDRGKVSFFGHDMPPIATKSWRDLRTKMQMVFQDPLAALDRRMPIGEQIREPLEIHNQKYQNDCTEKTRAIMEAVGLRQDQYHRYPQQLSGGQRQRVVIARALIMEPQLLVCDEPVSALDVSIQAQVINLLRDLQDRHNLTLVFISHDLKVVRNIADRLIVMYLGRIVEEGDSSAIFTSPRHPYTRALISSIPIPGKKLDERIILQGEPPDPAHRPTGCAFHPRCRYATDICKKEVPELKDIEDDSRVACFNLY